MNRVGVNWYATRRHLIKAGGAKGGFDAQESVCGEWVYDPQSQTNRNIVRRREGKGISTLPMCKHCERRAA